MLRTATPPMVRNVGRDRWLRLANSTSGAIASRRFMACAFSLAEKLRRSGSVTSGREANRLDWLGSERSASAVQSGPDSSGCLKNFSCASTVQQRLGDPDALLHTPGVAVCSQSLGLAGTLHFQET